MDIFELMAYATDVDGAIAVAVAIAVLAVGGMLVFMLRRGRGSNRG